MAAEIKRVFRIGGSYVRIAGDSFAFGFVRDLSPEAVEDEPKENGYVVNQGDLLLHRQSLGAYILSAPREFTFKS